MISLRGELHRDRNSWKWSGVWAYGSLPQDASLSNHSKKSKNPSMRPFIYAWNRPRSADSVLVPSANLPSPEKEETKHKKQETSQQPKDNANIVDQDSTDKVKTARVKSETSVDNDVTSKRSEQVSDPRSAKGAIDSTDAKASKDTDGKIELQSVDSRSQAESIDKKTEGSTADSDTDKKDKIPTKEDEVATESNAVKQDKAEAARAVEDPDVSNKQSEPSDLETSKSASETVDVSLVTYASTLPDEPDYTEAGTVYEDKCPADGSWTGYFENVSQRKDRNCSRVQENFCLFFNSTPSKDARRLFLDDSPEDSAEPTDQAKDGDSSATIASLPPGRIHVRGKGTNQFGTFELLGSYDMETNVLECQRMYVTTAEEDTPSRRRQSVTRAPRTKSVVEAGESTTTTNTPARAYNTRKRQFSWKRANVSDDSDDDEVTSGRRSSSGKKRARTLSEGRKSPVALTALLGTTPKPGVKTTIAVPTGSGTKRPSPSPRSSATPRKRSPPANKGAPPAAAAAHLMKLPVTGDPREARWRAAHFMYYQRSDPAAEEVGGSSAPSFVVYEGELLHGDSLREGRGVCLYSNGTVYEGSWKRNKEHGTGTLMTSDRKRIIYKGEWERGKMHGQGVYNYAYENPLYMRRSDSPGGPEAGSRYEGEFKENTRHGVGKYILPNGSFYDGEWRDNVMSGRGTFHWVDGSSYIGQWKDGKRNGQGILESSDGFKYDGTWVQNAMEGRGAAIYPSGQQYEGLWVAGRREGRGTIRFTNGAVYEGRFRDDCIEGQGTMKMPRSVAVTRPKISESEKEEGKVENEKDDWMIPIHFQSDMGHIHQKAGFTLGGN